MAPEARPPAWWSAVAAVTALACAILRGPPYCTPVHDPYCRAQALLAQRRQEVALRLEDEAACVWRGPVAGALHGSSQRRLQEKSLHEALRACDAARQTCSGVFSMPAAAGGFVAAGPGAELRPSETGQLAYWRECTNGSSTAPTPAPPSHPQGNTSELPGDAAPLPPEPDLKAWELPAGKSAQRVGYKLGAHASILVSVASYRDWMCRTTVEDAVARARHPGRLVFAIVDQRGPGDERCVPTPVECRHAARPPRICEHLRRVRLHEMDARHARGPTRERHRADKLYRGETFVLQIDSHMAFVQDWDVKMVRQWQNAKDEMAVLTAYPTIVDGSINGSDGRSLRKTTPVMCRASIMPDSGLVRFDQASEVAIAGLLAPVRQPFWAAGLSFSRGHRVLRVPYDCCTPQLFMGEEFAMAMRMFTHGYTFFSFTESLVFHFYPQERPPGSRNDFRTDEAGRLALHGTLERSECRVKLLAGLDADAQCALARRPSPKYGLGSARPLGQYFSAIGLQVQPDGTAFVHKPMDLCREVKAGRFGLDAA